MMIRVLVAEDSATARALLVRVLESDPGITVVGEAKDGEEAVAMTRLLRPDLVTMDIHMPRMDGLEATREIMGTVPTPIVIVTGSTTAREVRSSMETLRIGALDVLVKLPAPGSAEFAGATRHLIAIVKAMARVKVVRHWWPGPAPASTNPGRAPAAGSLPVPPPPPGLPATGMPVRVVAIATSTGGPQALHQLLSRLPATFAAPILVVQHISPGFTAGLADWLGTVCAFRVKVAAAGEASAPRTVYIAPDDRHLGVTAAGEIQLSGDPAVGGFRPSGTFLFESVARAFGASVVAVILTGMGEDGMAGLRAVRRAGGRIIAQDEKSSVVFGMPGAAVAAGLADAVLPLDLIAPRLAALAS